MAGSYPVATGFHPLRNPTTGIADRCARATDATQSRHVEQRDELAPLHVWMAPAWQEIIWRAAQRSLAVMCPAC